MSLLGAPFEVIPSLADEDIGLCEPQEYAKALSVRKAQWVAQEHNVNNVLAADTIVYVDGQILGKPRDTAQAYSHLKMLEGNSHFVYTGVTLIHNGQAHTFCEETKVFFRPLSDDLIWQYINTGDPMDKAGAYGIQGMGARFVERIEGDFFNVMGLPLCSVSKLLESLKIIDGGGEL